MANKHLTDVSYLESLSYKDNHYLITVCQTLWEFVKNAPIPMCININNDKSDKSRVNITVYVGNKFQTFPVDNNISYFDFVFLVKMYTQQFYPQFSFEEEVEVDLDTEAMLKIVAETKASLNDVVFYTKKEMQKQKGIILKAMFPKDEFLFEYNGVKSIRTSIMSNNIEEIVPLKKFLPKVRNMFYSNKNGRSIRDYILNNSKEIKVLPLTENDVIIDYPKSMMMNFFKIHYNDLADQTLEKICDLQHRWGKFVIQFADDLNEHECIEYYKKRRRG